MYMWHSASKVEKPSQKGSSQSFSKTKIGLKPTYMWHSPSKGEKPNQLSAGSLKSGFFGHIMILSHFLKEKNDQ